MLVLQLTFYKSRGLQHPEKQRHVKGHCSHKCMKYQFVSFPFKSTSIFYLVNTCQLNCCIISLAIKTANNKFWNLNNFFFFFFAISVKLFQVMRNFYQSLPNFLDLPDGKSFKARFQTSWGIHFRKYKSQQVSYF